MTRVNLLQPRLPSQEVLSRRRVRAANWGVVALAGVSVLALVGIMASRFILQARLESIENQIAAEAPMAREAVALEKAIREAEKRAELVSQLPDAEERGRCRRRSSVRRSQLPDAEERLAALVARVDGARPAGCTIQRIVIQEDGLLAISGTASSHETVAYFIDQLRNLPDLATVEFQDSAVSTGKSGGIAFKLQGRLAQPQEFTSEGGDQA